MTEQIEWFDARRLRGILAMEMVTVTRLAQASGLNREYLSTVLTGRRTPGELCLIRLQRGMRKLGLSLDATQQMGGPDHAA